MLSVILYNIKVISASVTLQSHLLRREPPLKDQPSMADSRLYGLRNVQFLLGYRVLRFFHRSQYAGHLCGRGYLVVWPSIDGRPDFRPSPLRNSTDRPHGVSSILPLQLFLQFQFFFFLVALGKNVKMCSLSTIVALPWLQFLMCLFRCAFFFFCL